MRFQSRRLAIGLGTLLLLAGTGCGEAKISAGVGSVGVTQITSPLLASFAAPFEITGSNFASIAGTAAVVRFEATTGTPFADGTSAVAQVPGTVQSNSTVVGEGPVTTFGGIWDAFVTVILPSGVEGRSADPIAQFLGVPALAVDDDYDTVGNFRLARGAGDGLLANDLPPGLITVSNFDNPSVNGGDVAVNADGSFTYDPPVGFEGTDTFQYEITGTTATSTATVTIAIAEMVWFIDASAAPGGDGRSASPFDDIAPFMAIQGGAALPGDTVFLDHAGGAPYTGPLLLLDDQLLLGQGVDLVVGGTTLVPASSKPLLTAPAGTTVTLAANNTVRGLDVGNAAGRGIFGAAPGSLGLDTVAANSTGGAAVDLQGGTLAVTFDSLTSTNSPAEGIFLRNSAGSFSVAGTTSVTNPATVGIRLQDNTGTFTFSDVTLATTAGDGLVATGGGTLAVTGAGNTIQTTTGTALHVTNTTIGASGVTFRSISSNGAASGIVLENTGTSGGLTVTGDGTGVANASGGTIQNATGIGIRLQQTQDVSFTQIDVDTSTGHGIQLSSVNTFTYQDAEVNAAGGADDQHGIQGLEVHGNILIEDVEFQDINEDGIEIVNSLNDDAVTDTVTFRRLLFLDHTPAGWGEHAVDLQATGTADLDVLIDDCTFDIGPEGSLGVSGISTGPSALVLMITGCTFDAGDAFGSGSIELVASDTSTATFNVLDNTLQNSKFTPIIANNDDDATSFATIRDNDIDVLTVFPFHNGYGIALRQDENGTFTALVQDNTIDHTEYDAIRVLARDTTDGTGVLNATIVGNTNSMPISSRSGIYAESQDTNTLCANIYGNIPVGTNILPGIDDDIHLSEAPTAMLIITQLMPTAAVDPDELDDANEDAAHVPATVGWFGTPSWGHPPCPTPPPVP